MTDESSQSIANHTLALLRAMDRKLDHVVDTLSRHDVRLGRLERDMAEVKSDLVLLENRLLTQTNEILRVMHRLDEQSASAAHP